MCSAKIYEIIKTRNIIENNLAIKLRDLIEYSYTIPLEFKIYKGESKIISFPASSG